MRKILLASAAAAALLVGPAVAQNQPDKPQQSEQKAGKPDQAQKPGMSAQSEKMKEPRQAQDGQDKAKGAPDMNKQPTGQSNRQTTGQGAQTESRPSGTDEAQKGQGAQKSSEPKAGAAEKKATSSDKKGAASGQAQSDQQMKADQPTKGDRKKGTTTSTQQGTTPPNQQGTSTGQQGTSTQSSQKGTSTPSGQQGQGTGTSSTQTGQSGSTPQSGSTSSGTSTSSSTTQGTGAAASLNQEQVTKFNQVIERQKVQSINNVNFSLAVGSAIPSSVRFYDVPSDIVTVYPEFRGKKFVVVRDEIVIIEPGTRKIVSVIPRSGRTTTGTTTGSTSRLQLAPEKRRLIRETVIKEQSVPRCADVQVTVGADVPRSIPLRPLPDLIVREVPEIRSYNFCLKGEEVVLVDPNEYRIVEIIQ